MRAAYMKDDLLPVDVEKQALSTAAWFFQHARLFKKERDLDLPDGFPSRFRTAVEFAKFYRPGLRYEPLSLADPVPFFHELSDYLRDLFRKRSTTTRG